MPVTADKPSRAGKAGAAKAGLTRRKPARKTPPPKPTPEQSTPLGRRIIEGMEEILHVLETEGMEGVKKKFTFHQLKKPAFPKPALGKADVVAIRTALGASQRVFAGLLGVSVATVRAWEQGVNAPSGMATRFLTEIRTNPDYWKARLKQAIS